MQLDHWDIRGAKGGCEGVKGVVEVVDDRGEDCL